MTQSANPYLSQIASGLGPLSSSAAEPAPVAPPFGSFSGAPAPAGPPVPPPVATYGAGGTPAGAFDPGLPTGGAYGAGGVVPSAYFDNSPPPGVTPPPPPAGPPAHGPQGGAPPSFLQRVHGAMGVKQPAREVEMRGPQLIEAQQDRNAAFQGAIGAVRERAEHTQAADMALALEEQRRAGIREDAANYSAAERANELAQRQADFDSSTKALSQQAVDPGRFWSNASVGTKIASLISVALGGFIAGKRGGPNVGMDAVNRMVDNDIKAQEFAYNAARDTTNAKQTAFSLAMQKYQNIDAARAAARAAALDVAVGMANQKAALWKGTESGNHAIEAAAQLTQDRMNQVAQGVAFVPAKTVAVSAQYVDPRTGLTYDDKEAKGLVAKLDEREEKRDEHGRTVAGQVMVEEAKAGLKGDEKKGEMQKRWVPTSSTGQGYYAPTEKEGTEHREQQAATQEVIDLIDKIKTDSKELGYTGRAATGVPGGTTEAGRRIASNHTMLLGAANRAQKFGALDKGATDLLKEMTGDPVSIRGNEANLNAIRAQALEKRRELEKSATGEKPGALPSSLTFHDGAK